MLVLRLTLPISTAINGMPSDRSTQLAFAVNVHNAS
jgi:hypothetical protein